MKKNVTLKNTNIYFKNKFYLSLKKRIHFILELFFILKPIKFR